MARIYEHSVFGMYEGWMARRYSDGADRCGTNETRRGRFFGHAISEPDGFEKELSLVILEKWLRIQQTFQKRTVCLGGCDVCAQPRMNLTNLVLRYVAVTAAL